MCIEFRITFRKSFLFRMLYQYIDTFNCINCSPAVALSRTAPLKKIRTL